MHDVLRLEIGEPRWYPIAVLTVTATVFLALLLTPLQWQYALAVAGLAAATLGADWMQRRGRGRFTELRVYPNYSVTLVDREDVETPVRLMGDFWVTRLLIVVPMEIPRLGKKHIAVARDRNHEEAFRRLIVLCRFGFAVDQ